MRRLPALFAALLLPTAQPLLLGTTLSTASLLVSVASAQAQSSIDALLEKARALLGKQGSEQEMIKLANQVLAIRQSADAYFYRAYAKDDLGDKQGAIADLNQAIAINPQYAEAYYNRGLVKRNLGDNQGAIADYNQAIAINPQDADTFNNRGNAKSDLGDKQGAIADYNQAIAINPQYAEAYRGRGIAYEDTGDLGLACRDWRTAASLGKADAADWVRKQCQ